MKYFLRKVKRYNEIMEAVLLCNDDENPKKVMSNEQLISCKEISEKEAIALCGKEAITGEKEE